MTRSRTSARAAGARTERAVADWLAAALDDDRIDRRVRTGAKDRGDVAGVRVAGQRLVIEVKDCARMDLAGWIREAHVEAAHRDPDSRGRCRRRALRAGPRHRCHRGLRGRDAGRGAVLQRPRGGPAESQRHVRVNRRRVYMPVTEHEQAAKDGNIQAARTRLVDAINALIDPVPTGLWRDSTGPEVRMLD